MIRIGFFGTPSLSAKVLEDCFLSNKIDVKYVVTQPDKPVGRHQEMSYSPVKMFALTHYIPCFQPTKVTGNEEFLKTIQSIEVDYFVVVAYGKILPLSVLQVPKKMPVNIHGSILPKYRGASPIQSALLDGETETGVTIMRMTEGMDEGEILSILPIAIDRYETSGSLFEKFSEVSGRFLVDTLDKLDRGLISPVAQDDSRATYCKKINKEDGIVHFQESAKSIFHKWQGFTPWPGISTFYEGKKLIIESCDYIDGSFGEIGLVSKADDGNVVVSCGVWGLILKQIKLEWKKSQSVRDFLNGHATFVGSVLSS